jgi:hypothetical protein
MKMKVVMGKKGPKMVARHLEYTCRNEETGCSYKVQSTAMSSGEMVPLRNDGSEVKVPE